MHSFQSRGPQSLKSVRLQEMPAITELTLSFLNLAVLSSV